MSLTMSKLAAQIIGLSEDEQAHTQAVTARLAADPELYGSLIAPKDGEGIPIWPVQDPRQLDDRRRGIGLPPLSEDLELYRRGAVMGPFMVPTPP
jgi:hypothetical protein